MSVSIRPGAKIALIVGGSLLSALILVAAVLASLGTPTPAARSAGDAPMAGMEPAHQSHSAERDQILISLEQKGFIKKRTCLDNETQVNLIAWLALDADGKRNVTRALAQLVWRSGQR